MSKTRQQLRAEVATALIEHPERADGHIAHAIGSSPQTIKVMRTRLEDIGVIPCCKLRQRRDGMWVGRMGNRWVLEADRGVAERKLSAIEEER